MTAHSASAFAVNPRCHASVQFVGNDRAPVLIVDDLLADPQALVEHAHSGAAFRKEDKDFYPGLRSALSMAYAENIHRHLHALLLETFYKSQPADIDALSCLLSLTMTRAQDLRPIQTVPHFDSFDSRQIAAVHYLCDEQFGGTAFYRHRSSGYESLDAQRIAHYAPQLKREVMQAAAQSPSRSLAYIHGDTALFACTGRVQARFNRAIFYRSNLLHSGDIAPGRVLPADPRTGRLTANTLAQIRPLT